MHDVGPADGGGRCLGQAEVADLAGLHELRHGADGVLDRHALVDAVLVVKVDVVDTESLKTRLGGAAHVLRSAVDAESGAVLGALVAELGSEHDLVASV